MSERRQRRLLLCLTGLLLLAVVVVAQEEAEPAGPESIFDFGAVRVEDPVEHTFSFKNHGREPLVVKNVQMLPPLVVTKMTSRIEPGAAGNITVRLGTPREKGTFKSPVVVNFSDGSGPLTFWVQGRIVAPIEVDPHPVFFVSLQRGETKQVAVDIINHEDDPLDIISVESASARFTPTLETLEAGQRYRLTLTVRGEGEAGRLTEKLTVVTSSQQQPFLELPVNTLVKERVYVSPPEVAFGTIHTQTLKARPGLVGLMTQRLMVYQVGGSNFQIQTSTDVPFVRLSIVGSNLKDRYQIEVGIHPEKLETGKFDGSIVIATNDPEFPRLVVPVSATVEGDW